MKRQGAFLLAGMVVAGLSVPAGAQDFLAYDGRDSVRAAGQGGERKTVDGIDFWMSGAPPRPFQVLGSISDERHATGIWGMISMSNLDRDIVKLTKKAGVDAVVLADAHDEVTGITGGSSSFGTASCAGGFCSGIGSTGGDATYMKQHDSKYWVVKYLSADAAGAAASAGPGGDKAAMNAALNAAGAAVQACHIVGENQIKKVLPGSAMVFLDTDQQVDDAYADLQNRKLSWGDFLRKRKTVLDGFTRGMLAQLKQVGLM